MNNADFWASIRTIIADGFTPEGLQKLVHSEDEVISGLSLLAFINLRT